jgi:hypothetical protein
MTHTQLAPAAVVPFKYIQALPANVLTRIEVPSTSLLITTERVERLVMCSVFQLQVKYTCLSSVIGYTVCDHAPCCGSLLRCKLRLAVDLIVICANCFVHVL